MPGQCMEKIKPLYSQRIAPESERITEAVRQQDAVVLADVVRHLPDGLSVSQVTDTVAAELPVALVYNGISHAVMMATPADLMDFARGFSLAEKIVDHPAQIYDVEMVRQPGSQGIELRIQIASACFMRLKERRRSLAGTTGCGLCGVQSLRALELQLPPVSGAIRLYPAALARALQQLTERQPLNAQTGAMHAAAWVNPDGEIVLLREDVGRHNALDKLIGALSTLSVIRNEAGGFVLMSSRASFELVQKTARAGIGLLATVSAPTSLAIDSAAQAGVCLIGFARETGFVVYTHPERILTE